MDAAIAGMAKQAEGDLPADTLGKPVPANSEVVALLDQTMSAIRAPEPSGTALALSRGAVCGKMLETDPEFCARMFERR